MLIGETIGRYEIVEHLGHGGMAEVYKAYHLQLERDVAIKILHPFLASEADFLTRFQREAKAVASLRHPNIVQVFDFDYDEERDFYYMVMEFIDGPSLKVRLKELLEEEGRMPLDEAVRIVASVGDALGYAHRRGMVHRDVKPANVMFNSEGQVILTDFGIAKMVNVAGLTVSGSMIGTPAYMAPEQGLGHAGDERADIYSLGAVLYQLVTGELPFTADTPMGVVLKHINAPLPSPRTLRPDVPPPLEKVMLRVMEKDANHRYQTAQEFVSALRRAAAGLGTASGFRESDSGASEAQRTSLGKRLFLRGRGSPPTPPPSDTQQATGDGKGRRWWKWGLAAIGALILIGGMIWVFSSASLGASGTVTPTATPSPTASAEVRSATLTAQAIADHPTASPSPSPFPSPSSTPTATPSPAPTPTPDLTATADALCEFDVEVVRESPADPTWISPGQAFTKRWTVRNSGTCAWRSGFQLVFVRGDALEGPLNLPVEETEVEDERTIAFDLVAPSENGSYEGVWRFQTEEGVLFGALLDVGVEVGPTPTPRVIATPTPEATVEPLAMSRPMLVSCSGDPGSGYRGGRVEWTAWGGGGPESYHFFYGTTDSQYKLLGPYNEFASFAHIMTYFTVSGDGPPWPQLEDCGLSDWGESGTCETASGQQVAWWKVVFDTSSCPGQ